LNLDDQVIAKVGQQLVQLLAVALVLDFRIEAHKAGYREVREREVVTPNHQTPLQCADHEPLYNVVVLGLEHIKWDREEHLEAVIQQLVLIGAREDEQLFEVPLHVSDGLGPLRRAQLSEEVHLLHGRIETPQ